MKPTASPHLEIVFGIDFMVPPAEGTLLMYDKQAFVAEGIEPYTRKDGAKSLLIIWSTRCIQCGCATTIKTAMRTKWPARRCPTCIGAKKPSDKDG